MAKKRGLTQVEAVEIVLRESGRPLSTREIYWEIQRRQLINFSSKDPHKSIRGRISEDIRRQGKSSRFIRLSRGVYKLRKFPKTILDAIEVILSESEYPMAVEAIVKQLIEQELFQGNPETSVKSIHARINSDIKYKGHDSRFKRIKPRVYTLRDPTVIESFTKLYQKRYSKHDKELGLDRVLVFPRSILDNIGFFHGIRTDHENFFQELLHAPPSLFMHRPTAESSLEHKQIVSYVMIKHGNSILRFTRGRISSIGNYLFGEYSIGFGGHVQERDLNFFSLKDGDLGYRESVRRELIEEIGIDVNGDSVKSFRLLGVLNDESSELGIRHFAFIHQVDLGKKYFEKREMSINKPQFVSIPQTGKDFEGYEYWSKLCLLTFYRDQLSFKCHIQPRKNFRVKKHSKYILITGFIGSGKSEACALLEREFGFRLVRCSRILQEIVGCGPIEEIGRERLQEIGLDFINSQNGHYRLAKGIFNYMQNLEHSTNLFVLDGLRYRETLEELELLLGSRITVIYIDNMIDNLYKYYRNREAEISFKDFLKVAHHEVEREIERFRLRADITVYNYGELDSYLDALRDYFRNELE